MGGALCQVMNLRTCLYSFLGTLSSSSLVLIRSLFLEQQNEDLENFLPSFPIDTKTKSHLKNNENSERKNFDGILCDFHLQFVLSHHYSLRIYFEPLMHLAAFCEHFLVTLSTT